MLYQSMTKCLELFTEICAPKEIKNTVDYCVFDTFNPKICWIVLSRDLNPLCSRINNGVNQDISVMRIDDEVYSK